MMLKPRKLGANVRQSFSKIEAAAEMPNLIEVQKDSYEWFLREGLNEVLRDVSPIVDYSGTLYIDFVDFTLENNPKYGVEECKERDATYSAALRVTARLLNKETGEHYWDDLELMLAKVAFAMLCRRYSWHLPVRALTVRAIDLMPAASPTQLDLFSDLAAQERESRELEREMSRQRAVLQIRKKYGKNAILRGMNFFEGATARQRNA